MYEIIINTLTNLIEPCKMRGPMCTAVEIILPSSTFKDSYNEELLSYSYVGPLITTYGCKKHA